MNDAVHCDEPEYEAVTQRSSAQRHIHVVTVRGIVDGWVCRRCQGKPGVAPQAAIPPQPVQVPREGLVFGPKTAGVRPEQLVSVQATAQQLVAKSWTESMRALSTWGSGLRRRHMSRLPVLMPPKCSAHLNLWPLLPVYRAHRGGRLRDSPRSPVPDISPNIDGRACGCSHRSPRVLAFTACPAAWDRPFSRSGAIEHRVLRRCMEPCGYRMRASDRRLNGHLNSE
jgi:hypothetical protein